MNLRKKSICFLGLPAAVSCFCFKASAEQSQIDYESPTFVLFSAVAQSLSELLDGFLPVHVYIQWFFYIHNQVELKLEYLSIETVCSLGRKVKKNL